MATKRRMSDRRSDLMYHSIDDDLNNLYRNTVIPDETFGPDEERIFIDVDPYDLNESIFGLQHGVKPTPDVMEKMDTKHTTDKSSDIDYIEEWLKNVKRQWQKSRNDEYKGQWSTTLGSHVKGKIVTESITAPGNDGSTNVYCVANSSTKKETLEKEEEEEEEEDSSADAGDKPINRDAYGNLRTEDLSSTIFTTAMTTGNLEDRSRIAESGRRGSSHANRTFEYSDAFDEESDKSRKIEPYVESRTTNYTIVRFPITRELENRAREDTTLIDDRRSSAGDNSAEDAEDVSRDQEDRIASMEEASLINLKELSRGGQHPPNGDKPANVSTSVLTTEGDTTRDPAVESLVALGRAYNVAVDNTENLVFEWITTDWSKCSQACGGSGFQMRGAQCTVRSVDNSTRVSPKTVIGATLCEDAGHQVPQKVRPCGMDRCSQWHTTEMTPCETSRCFNWKTTMQKRDISCRLVHDTEDGRENVTLLDASKCDEATRPLQRQECYNDACKGVWRVGEWAECTAFCEEDGMKYRVLQCVWFGTKKSAGNACRDIPRPLVMKTCRGPPCPQSPEDCKDNSQLCSRVTTMNMCKVPLYKKQCCASCR